MFFSLTPDVELSFPGLGKKDEYLRVDARLGISSDGVDNPIDVVDVTAMLAKDGLMTVHGGWIRVALQDAGLEGATEGWDVILIDVVVSDPSDSYRILGRMGNVINNGVLKAQKTKREKLSQVPTTLEAAISDDMKTGKKPKRGGVDGKHGLRRLTAGHKKILVHGYCAQGNPFPFSHFTDAVAFSHWGSPTSVPHDEFARAIDTFADGLGLEGCGCIAHSQGGAACTHLYTYYWSCLDYAAIGGSRLIQTVGTPYHGTALAGNLAAIGAVFGIACGSNNDLTYSGAAAWLSGIPSWARAAVRYYTTSFKDVWWRWDYCHVATDLVLSDPEDGTTELAYGQLSGATNGGHTYGQCHTTEMRDPGQTTDYGRNSDMNVNARY